MMKYCVFFQTYSLIRQTLTVDLPSAYFPKDRAFMQFFHTEIILTFDRIICVISNKFG